MRAAGQSRCLAEPCSRPLSLSCPLIKLRRFALHSLYAPVVLQRMSSWQVRRKLGEGGVDTRQTTGLIGDRETRRMGPDATVTHERDCPKQQDPSVCAARAQGHGSPRSALNCLRWPCLRRACAHACSSAPSGGLHSALPLQG